MDRSKKKDAVKKVIAAMTVGKDVSALFPGGCCTSLCCTRWVLVAANPGSVCVCKLLHLRHMPPRPHLASARRSTYPHTRCACNAHPPATMQT